MFINNIVSEINLFENNIMSQKLKHLIDIKHHGFLKTVVEGMVLKDKPRSDPFVGGYKVKNLVCM